MQFIEFESPEQMRDYLERQGQAAAKGIHAMQESIGFGSHWVQFYDIVETHFIFGRVLSEGDILRYERKGDATWDEAAAAVRKARAEQEAGVLLSLAFDREHPEGDLCSTHKSHVWPIDKSVYDEAVRAGGVVSEMEEWARVSLLIALSGWRGR